MVFVLTLSFLLSRVSCENAEKTYADIEKNTNNTGNNSDNSRNTSNQQASNEKQQTTQQQVSTEQPKAEENVVAPTKAKISSLKNKKSKSFVAIWKKVKDAKGYEVQYALNKKFTKSKKSKTTIKLTLTVKKMKKGKTYYVRVRAYNMDSGSNKVYGKWSAVKKVKIRK